MARRALVVGCNYPGSNSALNGCVTDANDMQTMLSDVFGFDDVTVMVDTDPDSEQPTGANIKACLNTLVSEAQPGDVLFFSFSGHGTQEQTEEDDEEEDGLDEYLVACDYNNVSDNDLRKILSQLPEGVKFTMVADCCHSGTVLDQPTVQISGPKAEDPELPPEDIEAIVEEMPKFNGDTASRSLASNFVVEALSNKLGVELEPHQLHAALAAVFGADAPTKLQGLAERLDTEVEELGGEDYLCAQEDDEEEEECSPELARFRLAQRLLEEEPDLVGETESFQLPSGITLITGCQAHQTSADCPGEPAYGALTRALTSTIKLYKEANPDCDISSRSLVHYIRQALHARGMKQDPCLECEDDVADEPFILSV